MDEGRRIRYMVATHNIGYNETIGGERAIYSAADATNATARIRTETSICGPS
jgi:hypothetical protein